MKDHSIKFERLKNVREIHVGITPPPLRSILLLLAFMILLFAAWGFVFAMYAEAVSERLGSIGPEGWRFNIDFHEEFPDEGKRRIMAALLFSWLGVIGGVQLGVGKWFAAKAKSDGRGLAWWLPYLTLAAALVIFGCLWSVLFSSYLVVDDEWEFGILSLFLCIYHFGIAFQIGSWRAKRVIHE